MGKILANVNIFSVVCLPFLTPCHLGRDLTLSRHCVSYCIRFVQKFSRSNLQWRTEPFFVCPYHRVSTEGLDLFLPLG